jgi:hypothetical protein
MNELEETRKEVLWHTLRYYPSNYLEELSKIRKTKKLLTIASIWVENGIQNLLNTKQER